jgi:hypothetical protein
MDRLVVLLAFVAFVVVVVVIGVRLGMLLAPRIDRWADREAEPRREDEGGDDD